MGRKYICVCIHWRKNGGLSVAYSLLDVQVLSQRLLMIIRVQSRSGGWTQVLRQSSAFLLQINNRTNSYNFRIFDVVDLIMSEKLLLNYLDVEK